MAAAESTEKADERPAVLLLLAELTLELELGAAAASAMSGRCGAGCSMAALGGLGGVDEDAAVVVAAII